MIKTPLTQVGLIQRTHGVNGEVQVGWDDDFDPEKNKLKSVFLLIEGIPIPFFITSHRSKGYDSLVKFEDVENHNQASELVGLKVFASIKRSRTTKELTLNDLIGYTIISSKGIQVGTVEEFHDYSGNLVFSVLNTAGKELLIPASPDLIIEVNEESNYLIIELPDGIADD